MIDIETQRRIEKLEEKINNIEKILHNIIENKNQCVYCGELIPEGRHVCTKCAFDNEDD